jgi:hypothetical protein
MGLQYNTDLRINSGSITINNGTGSLFGTASYALTSSYIKLLAGEAITINTENGGIAISGSNTASYVSSSVVDGPFGFDSIQTASFSTTASFVDLIAGPGIIIDKIKLKRHCPNVPKILTNL